MSIIHAVLLKVTGVLSNLFNEKSFGLQNVTWEEWLSESFDLNTKLPFKD